MFTAGVLLISGAGGSSDSSSQEWFKNLEGPFAKRTAAVAGTLVSTAGVLGTVASTYGENLAQKATEQFLPALTKAVQAGDSLGLVTTVVETATPALVNAIFAGTLAGVLAGATSMLAPALAKSAVDQFIHWQATQRVKAERDAREDEVQTMLGEIDESEEWISPGYQLSWDKKTLENVNRDLRAHNLLTMTPKALNIAANAISETVTIDSLKSAKEALLRKPVALTGRSLADFKSTMLHRFGKETQYKQSEKSQEYLEQNPQSLDNSKRTPSSAEDSDPNSIGARKNDAWNNLWETGNASAAAVPVATVAIASHLFNKASKAYWDMIERTPLGVPENFKLVKPALGSSSAQKSLTQISEGLLPDAVTKTNSIFNSSVQKSVGYGAVVGALGVAAPLAVSYLGKMLVDEAVRKRVEHERRTGTDEVEQLLQNAKSGKQNEEEFNRQKQLLHIVNADLRRHNKAALTEKALNIAADAVYDVKSGKLNAIKKLLLEKPVAHTQRRLRNFVSWTKFTGMSKYVAALTYQSRAQILKDPKRDD